MSEISKRLRQGREAVATGHLALDREKARAKLQQFRLPDPHMYVLQLVRAASVLGATTIDFVVEPSTTTCVFDATFDEYAADEMWAAAFEERSGAQSSALRNLALAISSAQALNPAFIEVDSGGQKHRFVGEETDVGSSEPTSQTTIVVKEKFRFGHLVEFFESFVGLLPEARALERVCKYSLMNVRCNGTPVSISWNRPTKDFQVEGGAVRVHATRALTQVRYVLLRDDVMVDSVVGEELFVAARAAHNSRDAPMDLTGISLRARPASFPRDAQSAYHQILCEWLDRNEVLPVEKRESLTVLSREIAEQGIEVVGPGTRDLLAKLVVEPMFDCAIAANSDQVALRPPDRDVVEFSTRQIELPNGPPHVVHLPAESELIELLPLLGFSVRDCTIPLAQSARKVRNHQRFSAQPVRAPRPPGPHGLVVGSGQLRAVVDPLMGRDVGRGIVLHDDRVLFEREGPVPFRVEISGPVRPNEFFDNLDRDADFDQFALLILATARRLFDRFTEHPDQATLILNRLARNQFNSDLLGLIGYGRTEAAKFLKQHKPPRDVDDGYRWLLQEAGPLADAKLFGSVVGPPTTLRAIIESVEPPVFATKAGVRAQRLLEDRPVLHLSPARRRLVELVRPDAEEIHAALRRESSENSLMGRPVFRPATSPPALYRHEVEGSRFSLVLELIGGDSNEAEAFLVWRGRLLAHHRWSSPLGVWRLVVRSDAFEPVVSHDDVVQDELFAEILATFAHEVPRALAAWRQSVVRSGRLEGHGWELYINSALLHGDVVEVVLPAWRHEQSGWEAVLASLEDLGASARRNAVLRYVPPGVEPQYEPRDAELMLQLPKSIDTQLLELGALAGAQIVPAGDAAIQHKFAVYHRTANAPRTSLPGAVAVRTSTVDGVAVTTRLLPTRKDAVHVVEIVWRGRVLERVEGTDVASFFSTVSGPQIGPDPSLRRTESGRTEALAAAATNARTTIVHGCELLSRDPRNDTLRDVLAQIATASDHRDEPWQQALLQAPLLKTPRGYESHSQRAARLVRATGDEILDEVARLLRAARGANGDLVHEFTLAGFGWAEDGQEELCVANEMGVFVRRDHPLVRTIDDGDERALHFLASCVFTQINAYYQEISDANELALQRGLLGVAV